MLGWITGQDEQLAHSAAGVLEPPETPAPVFAIRAFRSALFGTPGAEEEEEKNGQRDTRPKPHATNQQRRKSDSLQIPSAENAGNGITAKKADIDMAANAMGSPTKSILVTPGTTSNRRKTVSFGDGVVDNERKADGQSPTKSPSKTPTNQPINTSSQWSTGSSDTKNKPRSKLTQALLDSRDKPKDLEPTRLSSSEAGSSSDIVPKMMSLEVEEDANDETMNLDEPRSQSGKYWKAEFDNYRTKTNWEIKKLIQYRSVAKAYAKKKDAEALRLAEKLQAEEAKVSGMERHVSQLASTMVTENTNADKEKLVQDLAKQTALALQYKHRVNSLRKLLEQNGVIGNEVDEAPAQPGSSGEELRKTQQALDQANAKIEEMKGQKSDPDISKLQDLAQSSEKKASELEKENMTLKQTLARVKQEMTKYEGRRKEKEAKLKQREAKLETRIQEYRERLKTASQQHRHSEDVLRGSFVEERRRMQEQIDFLKLKLTTIERMPESLGHGRYSYSPRKGHAGIQIQDFGQSSPQKGEDDETDDIDEPPSPSPRSKDRHARHSRTVTGDVLDLKRAAKAMGMDDDDEQLIYMEESPKKGYGYRSHTIDNSEVPPSSPPDLTSAEPPTRAFASKQKYDRDSHRPYLTSHTTMNSLARHLTQINDSQQIRTQRQSARRSPTKFSLDALSGLPNTHMSDRSGKRHSRASVPLDAIPVDRMLAAQARLKRKGESRKGKEEGKENIKAFNT
ncbi:hypothetical protein ASPWEDRAFT_99793 [Aspergillus wentii DTO 134E9]|uniref:Spindle pole body-associated protein cut12 domain-containing protein n=1 Tax=Aspergillus wentii DTO 134E9 TaxID=1073089 RepID=A0A1L9S2P4_ASPWE|nr:uncharacterized protein ASPWEDRAFT_99793 [Aspergillus wentii DTO 134E9]OJJ41423.1 hypothetical protein ASPWEDRAFT_99793 [Aspergillus wentii DTO 134E9]